MAPRRPSCAGWRPTPKALSARRIDLEAAQHYGVRWDPSDGAWILPIRHPDGDLLGWQRKVSFEQLVERMYAHDLQDESRRAGNA